MKRGAAVFQQVNKHKNRENKKKKKSGKQVEIGKEF